MNKFCIGIVLVNERWKHQQQLEKITANRNTKKPTNLNFQIYFILFILIETTYQPMQKTHSMMQQILEMVLIQKEIPISLNVIKYKSILIWRTVNKIINISPKQVNTFISNQVNMYLARKNESHLVLLMVIFPWFLQWAKNNHTETMEPVPIPTRSLCSASHLIFQIKSCTSIMSIQIKKNLI